MLRVTKVQVKDGGWLGMSNLSCNGAHALATFSPVHVRGDGSGAASRNQYGRVRILLRAIEVSGKPRIMTGVIDLALWVTITTESFR
jgi:hypothetical protein